ncbi:hypothetical protein MMYC01_203283 [Madurella mycetomatis]|uniref:Transcriptional regulator n=1 Tax=Madurella mycetomatis TaxID=100816 RepID=A0A175W9M9_9PEZI|nr:hypothetical protein MMYC01_203283 [Madurella mycetomatis]
MAPNKLTDRAIAAELARVVREIYHGPESDQLTVNYARQVAEEKLMLDSGFLKEGDWKAKSKQIILDTLNEVEGADSSSVQTTPAAPKPAAKNTTTEGKKATGRVKKQQKKAASPAEVESELSDAGGIVNIPERPTKKRKLAKGPRRKNNVVSDDEDGLSDTSEDRGNVQSPRPADKKPPKRRKESESELSDVPDVSPKPVDEESELSDVLDEPPKPRREKTKTEATAKPKAPVPASKDDKNNDNDSSSELSSVIDDPPPPPKRKGKSKDAASAPSRAKGKNTKSSTAGGADISPDETQIKLLQSQLAKCGVRKVWAFEFKKRGDDTPRAKIKRLKEMLAEVGMAGRFSEAKAREIKEMRELQADLQDVMQGERSWGLESTAGRGSRRKAAAAATQKRSMKEESDDEDEEEEEADGSDDDDGGARLAVRGKGPVKRRADLAFLDDESESE